MTQLQTKATPKRWMHLGALTALGMVLTLGMVAPAHADRDDRGRGYDRDWRAHEIHARQWHRHYYVAPPPHYVYAPPPVYYPPPEPSPGINLILPLHFN
jgi:hypothetical protein